MASTQVLKQRIRSVKNTKQITKAMQLVAASKMRRAQETTKASAPYSLAARELLTSISRHESVKGHALFLNRPISCRLLIVVASDKGLAGAYNSNVMKMYAEELKLDSQSGVQNMTITIGRKAAQFVARIKGIDVIGSYEDLPEDSDSHEFRAILNTARDEFISRKVDAVDIIFTEFVSSIRQEAGVTRILPAGFEPMIEPGIEVDAEYEPGVSKVLDAIAFRLVEAQIFQALLDARASEHSMRMLAMKNATDNATDLVDDLTLAMNKSRQGAITQELAEISGGVEALNL
ncbi:MAG: ATP synthase F1 subunit gamma [Candidatus Saccharimonadales bacterium]